MKIQIYHPNQVMYINGGPARAYTYFSFLETHIKIGRHGDQSLQDALTIKLPAEYEIYVNDRLRWKGKKCMPKKTIYPIIERVGTENKK